MRKLFLFALFIVVSVFLSASQSDTYDWEDGGTALGTYVSGGAGLTLENTDEIYYSGAHCLKMTEDPLSSTPQAFIWWVTGLADGDEISAGFYVYDTSPGSTPYGRIWGHYTPPGGDIDSYSGSAGGNSTYSAGTGWSTLEHTWTFEEDSGSNDGLIVEARIYSTEGANIIWVDSTYIEVSSDTAVIHSIADEELPVTLSSFNAAYIDASTVLTWTTETEQNNQGWNIYRNEMELLESAIQINSDMIPGAGTSFTPTDYSYQDEYDVVPLHTYWYWLESVNISNQTTIHGPISLTIPDENYDPVPPDLLESARFYNSPNPFNPETMIFFELDSEEPVSGRIEIYDIRGNLVRSLHEGFIPETGISWDSTDEEGRKVASGIYFCRLQLQGQTYVNKMVLTK